MKKKKLIVALSLLSGMLFSGYIYAGIDGDSNSENCDFKAQTACKTGERACYFDTMEGEKCWYDNKKFFYEN